MLPFGTMIVFILGSMYLGIVTPTEAGAVGAILSLFICLARRRITWQSFWESILETLTVTAFILLIMFGASLMTYVFDYLRLAQSLVGAVKALEHVARHGAAGGGDHLHRAGHVPRFDLAHHHDVCPSCSR